MEGIRGVKRPGDWRPDPEAEPIFDDKQMEERLVIEHHDDNTVTIAGTRYSPQFFQEFGCSFPHMLGQVLRVDKKENGIITVTRLPEIEKQ